MVPLVPVYVLRIGAGESNVGALGTSWCVWGLHHLAGQAAHALIEEPRTVISHAEQDAHYSFMLDTNHSGCGANGVSFYNSSDNLDLLLNR